MNRGAFDFITKPIDFRDLRATIERALEHRALLRSAVESSGDGRVETASDRRAMASAPVLIHMEHDGMYADDADEGRPSARSGIKLSVLNATADGALVVCA